MEHGKNPLAVRRWSRPWDANVARTSGTKRSLDFWAITSRYRLKERSINGDNHGDGEGGLVQRGKGDTQVPL